MGSRAELFFSSIMSIFGLVVVVMSYQLGFGSMRQPQAGFFPLLIGVLIFLFGVLSVSEQLKYSWKTSASTMFEEGGAIRCIGTIACLIAWLLFMPLLGYIIVTFLVSLALFKVMGLEGRLYPLLLSIGVVFLIYVVFDMWLYIDLPRGIFE